MVESRKRIQSTILENSLLTQDKNKLSWGLFLGKNVKSLKTECKSSRQGGFYG